MMWGIFAKNIKKWGFSLDSVHGYQQQGVVMTIYEQIQKNIDYLEENLSSQVSCDDAAEVAGMSVRSFYNYFWMITGFSYKQHY